MDSFIEYIFNKLYNPNPGFIYRYGMATQRMVPHNRKPYPVITFNKLIFPS